MNVQKYGLEKSLVHYQLSNDDLVKASIDQFGARVSSLGAISVDTGKFTGRSPKDRFIVKDALTADKVWWGDINIPFDSEKFDALYDKVLQYLNGKELFIRDGFVCADQRFRLNVRTINEYAWSNLFVKNMFIQLHLDQLESFEEDWLVVNAPGFLANPELDGTRDENFAILNFTRKIALIGGTGYTGEMKKGIFSALNFLLPEKKVLPMHCSANKGEKGDTAVYFGLSGTGKTTLSADPTRKLIGDDEHGWTEDNIVFNFEGGCYAKVIDLSEEKEPDIYHAINKEALLENVTFFEGTNEVNFKDSSITQNTRVSYPIYNIDNIAIPSLGENPRNIFFLTADAFGVLPPVSKLTPGQAAYHFISGYTAKVAGTEEGIDKPTPSFSACFGAPFMPLHPTVYAEMLSQKMQESGANIWLINTGWSGGPYGEGSRIKLKYTRAMIHAILIGELDNANYVTHPIFNLQIPTEIQDVPTEILDPIQTWKNKEEYNQTASQLVKYFHENFKQFEDRASAEILAGAPGA